MSNLSPPSLVYVQGGFDDLRTIDIRFIQEAAKLGDVQILLYSDTVFQQVSKNELKFPFEERRYYLENIRYVNRLLENENTDKNALPSKTLSTGDSQPQVIWAVREEEHTVIKENFCHSKNIQYHIIPDKALTGFPFEIPNLEKPSTDKKVMVSGCFDWVHTGHVRFFEEVSKYGDLFVVVGHDENLRFLKGEGHPLFFEDERLYWVQAIKFVKHAMISTGNGWLDAVPEIERIKPDIFVVNKDGDVPEKRKYFKEMGIEYKILERKPKNSLQARVSTILRGF